MRVRVRVRVRIGVRIGVTDRARVSPLRTCRAAPWRAVRARTVAVVVGAATGANLARDRV